MPNRTRPMRVKFLSETNAGKTTIHTSTERVRYVHTSRLVVSETGSWHTVQLLYRQLFSDEVSLLKPRTRHSANRLIIGADEFQISLLTEGKTFEISLGKHDELDIVLYFIRDACKQSLGTVLYNPCTANLIELKEVDSVFRLWGNWLDEELQDEIKKLYIACGSIGGFLDNWPGFKEALEHDEPVDTPDAKPEPPVS